MNTFDLPPKKCEFRCVRLLQLLTIEEVRAFKKYLSSPYFRVSEAAVHLANYLLKLAPTFPPEKVTKAILFKRVYGKAAPFKEKKIRDLLSDLALHLDEFIGIERIRHDKVMRRKLVVERVASHNDLDLVHRELNTLEKAIQQRPNRSIDYYVDRAFALKYRIALPKQDSIRNRRGELDELSENLDRAVALQKGNLLTHLRNRQRALNTPYQSLAEDEVIQLIDASDNPVFRIYSIAINNIEESELEVLEEQFELCKLHVDKISYPELIDFYSLATNAANRLDDELRIARDLLAWEWSEFITKVISRQQSDTHINTGVIKTIYVNSVFVKKQEVAIKFIQSFIERGYNSAELDSVVNFIYAHYYFSINKLEDAATHIARTDLNNPDIGLTGRSLQIRIYFDLYFDNQNRYAEVLEYAIHALDKYTTRYNKANSTAASSRVHVFYCYKNLFRLSKVSGKEFEFLYDELTMNLSQNVGVTVYDWVVARADLLKQKSAHTRSVKRKN